MIKAGIIGASGYSGLELVRILSKHPEVNLDFISGTERVAGCHYVDLYPVLRGLVALEVQLTDVDQILQSDVDLIFLATPNETSLELVPRFLSESGKKVIDLSGAFRLKNQVLYPSYYGFENTHVDLLAAAVYGIPELNKDQIRQARFVANPGCYPTSVILALAPVLKAGLINTKQRVVIDSKSGVSGAGRRPTDNTHFVETNESFKAYNIHKHRHEPEIAQELSFAASENVKITFTPHLLPLNRGILSTIYAELKDNVGILEVRNVLNAAYSKEKFVRILPENCYAEIKHVANTPFCDIGVSIRNNELIMVSCIDNVLKGASSQAVQNLNLMFGFKEDLGL